MIDIIKAQRWDFDLDWNSFPTNHRTANHTIAPFLGTIKIKCKCCTNSRRRNSRVLSHRPKQTANEFVLRPFLELLFKIHNSNRSRSSNNVALFIHHVLSCIQIGFFEILKRKENVEKTNKWLIYRLMLTRRRRRQRWWWRWRWWHTARNANKHHT